MIHGLYPAAVTPFDEKGRIDFVSLARLFAFFEAAGCKGVVLAGTNGEGPSLSAVEKRDLLRDSRPLVGKLDVILGISTPSLDEAIWLCKRAEEFGASHSLLLAPGFFQGGDIVPWFQAVMDRSPVPVLIYNYPKVCGYTLTVDDLTTLAQHPQFAGLKDSSGEVANLANFREVVPEGKSLLIGNELLLIQALEAGWTGSISGAANELALWLAKIIQEWPSESSTAKHAFIAPLLQKIRTSPQPATHKAILHNWGILERPDVRLPLRPAGAGDLLEEIRLTLGISAENLGLPKA